MTNTENAATITVQAENVRKGDRIAPNSDYEIAEAWAISDAVLGDDGTVTVDVRWSDGYESPYTWDSGTYVVLISRASLTPVASCAAENRTHVCTEAKGHQGPHLTAASWAWVDSPSGPMPA